MNRTYQLALWHSVNPNLIKKIPLDRSMWWHFNNSLGARLAFDHKCAQIFVRLTVLRMVVIFENFISPSSYMYYGMKSLVKRVLNSVVFSMKLPVLPVPKGLSNQLENLTSRCITNLGIKSPVCKIYTKGRGSRPLCNVRYDKVKWGHEMPCDMDWNVRDHRYLDFWLCC